MPLLDSPVLRKKKSIHCSSLEWTQESLYGLNAYKRCNLVLVYNIQEMLYRPMSTLSLLITYSRNSQFKQEIPSLVQANLRR